MVTSAKWLLTVGMMGVLSCAPAGPPDGDVDPAEPAAAGEGAVAPASPSSSPVAVGTPPPKDPSAPSEPAWTPRPEDEVTPHQRLEFPEAMDTFFERLAVVDSENPPADADIIRVVHLGASMIGNDDLPAILREKFQTRFGDGGAGLVLLSRYMPNYRHRWVTINANNWEHCYIAYLCKSDGHYGLGGTTFWSKGGAATTIKTRDAELGGEAAHFELWYVAHKGGGKFELKIDRNEREVINTRSDTLEDRYHAVDVPQGAHKVSVRALGSGKARGYGVVLETEGPGLVWDQFSMLGAFTKRMLGWNEKHIAGQIEHRDPDLIVFTYGGNDTRRVATGKLSQEQYVEEYSTAVKRVRAGKPEASCLITSLTDRARSLKFEIKPKHVQMMVDAQREVAKQTGCAFFDSFGAMGGGGSLIKWRKMKPPQAEGDLKHLNHRGRQVLGGWIYDAIITGYVEHRTGKGAN